MDDYISRKSVIVGLDYIINELNKLITDNSSNEGYTDIKNQVEEIKRGVLKLPPEDVQPVVHCKDCVYWSSKKTRYCNMLKGTFQENDYCSYAERRTDECSDPIRSNH